MLLTVVGFNSLSLFLVLEGNSSFYFMNLYSSPLIFYVRREIVLSLGEVRMGEGGNLKGEGIGREATVKFRTTLALSHDSLLQVKERAYFSLHIFYLLL